MAEIPSVIFISCSDTKPDEIIQLMFGNEELPEKIQINEHIHAYPWYIFNQYCVDVQVNLCPLETKSISTQAFSETVGGVILYIDSSRNDAVDKMESWLPIINAYDADIKILLCTNLKCDGNKDCKKRAVIEWSIHTGFELVELEPVIVTADNIIANGIERIIQELHDRVRPRTRRGTQSPDRPGVLDEYVQDLYFGNSIMEVLENDDDLSKLFSRLSDMKARVASLSGNERKDVAEKIVRAFWKAFDEDVFGPDYRNIDCEIYIDPNILRHYDPVILM